MRVGLGSRRALKDAERRQWIRAQKLCPRPDNGDVRRAEEAGDGGSFAEERRVGVWARECDWE